MSIPEVSDSIWNGPIRSGEFCLEFQGSHHLELSVDTQHENCQYTDHRICLDFFFYLKKCTEFDHFFLIYILLMLRKERVNQNGRTNLEYRTEIPERPEHLPRIAFLATARSTKFDQIVKAKLAKSMEHPEVSQKQFYKTHDKALHEKAEIQRPRYPTPT